MVKRIIPAVRLCLTLAISAALPTLAAAASFDCAAARTPIEHAICDDAQLSALDSELAAAYQSAMKGQGDAAEQLRAQQRAWLRSRSPSGTVDLAALKAA